MRPPFLRYITGDAGNIDRLYRSVDIAREYPDIAKAQRTVLFEKKAPLKKFTTDDHPDEFLSARSWEPHLALARELGILDRDERWTVTISVGEPFLYLWEKEGLVPPTFLLLAQLLRYDRAMTVPFLEGILREGAKEGPKIISTIWNLLWKKRVDEMEFAEPPLPFSLEKETKKKGEFELKRTAIHHSQFRIRFLMKEEGLSLRTDQLKRIVSVFSDDLNRKFPSDYYSKVGFIIAGKNPSKLKPESIKKQIKSGFKIFKQIRYASAEAVFHYLNNKILPENFLDSKEFFQHIRDRKSYSVQPSWSKDDLLFTVKGI